MAYDIKSATILRGTTGNQSDYAAVAINDRFSDLDKKMDSKIGQDQFDKSVE